MNEDRKVNIHAALEMFTSDQLLFLGLLQRRDLSRLLFVHAKLPVFK